MPPLSAFARYTSSFIGVTLLTSFAFQGILHKRVSTTEHDRLTAHRTILESLVQRLKDGEDVGDGEIVRLIRLARGGGEEGGAIEDTPWRDVILGKRINEAKEEKALAEWNAAISDQSIKPKSIPVSPPPPTTPPVPNQIPTQSAKRPTFL